MAEAMEQEPVIGGEPWQQWPEYQHNPSEHIVLTVGGYGIQLYNFTHLVEGNVPAVHLNNFSRQYGSILAQLMSRYPAAIRDIRDIVVTDKFDTLTAGGSSTEHQLGEATLSQGLIELSPSALEHGTYEDGSLKITKYVGALLHEAGKFVVPSLLPDWKKRAAEAGVDIQDDEATRADALHAIVAFEYSGYVLEDEAPWKYDTMVKFVAKAREALGTNQNFPMRFSQQVIFPPSSNRPARKTP